MKTLEKEEIYFTQMFLMSELFCFRLHRKSVYILLRTVRFWWFSSLASCFKRIN